MKKITNGYVTKDSVTLGLPSLRFFEVTTKIQEDGSLKTEAGFAKSKVAPKPLTKEEYKKQKRVIKLQIIAIYFVAILLSFLVSYYFNSQMIWITSALVFIDIIKYENQIAFFLLLMLSFQITEDRRKLKGLHAAIEMGINAYNKFGRMPTVDELKRASKYSESCKYAKKGKFFVIALVLWIAASLLPKKIGSFSIDGLPFFIMYVLALVLASLLIKIIMKKGYYKYIAFFSLRKPKNIELEAVMETLQKIEEIEENPKKFFEENYPEVPYEVLNAIQEFECVIFVVVGN